MAFAARAEIVDIGFKRDSIATRVPDVRNADLEVAFSALRKARATLEDNIKSDVEEMGESAPRLIGVVSHPDYYANGTPIGNRTYLAKASSPTSEFFHGREPGYVRPYKNARQDYYGTLLGVSVTQSDLIGLMDFVTSYDDPRFAQYFFDSLTAKKRVPSQYFNTSQDIIDEDEKERIRRNDFIDSLHMAVKKHNKKAGQNILNISEEWLDQNPALRGLLEHKSWLTRIGYKRYLRTAFLNPLQEASRRPIIEKQILDKIFREAGLSVSSIEHIQ